MANWYVNYGDGSTTGYYAVAKWTALTAYSSSSNGGRGDYVRQNAAPSVGNERVFRCTTGGTSLASEPSWNLGHNATTTETAGPVWTECTGQEADQVSGTWKAPHARLANAFASGWGAAGDTFEVGDNHAETQSTAMTLTSPGTEANPCIVQCVSHTGTVPPVAADLMTTATITTTSTGDLTFTGSAFIYGLNLSCGGSSGNRSLVIGQSNNIYQVWNNCTLAFGSTGTCNLAIGQNGTAANKITWNNVTVTFLSTASKISVQECKFTWNNTPSAIGGSTFPATLFNAGTPVGGNILLEGIDLSALGSGKTLFGAATAPQIATLKDCKLGASVTIAATQVHPGGLRVLLVRSDSSGTNYRNEIPADYTGSLTTETTIIRTGGASDGTTGISWNLTTTANSKWIMPFEAFPATIHNSVTGSNVNVTLEGVWNAAALPNNDDIWFDVEYLGSASIPQGSFATGTKASFLATNAALTASTAAWDSLVAARQNSHAYSTGAVMKTAANAGRIFFCTSGGTSAGSDPGYNAVVDGGSITDGGATFRAGVRFKQTITLSAPNPAQVGYLYCYPKVAKASSTFYLDPKITLS